jgi:hypothetical protein
MTEAASKLSAEQDFLGWFASAFLGKGLHSKFHFGSFYSYCVSFSECFQGREIAGHGYDLDPSVATLKGAAELIERRLVIEYLRQHPEEPIRNTNGWAVHLSSVSAIEAARREGLERHILLYTYFHSGWSGFSILDRRSGNNGEAIFLVSTFSQNEHFAGMVIYRDRRFPGISFGYFADEIGCLQSSPRWNHALFEAVAFVERGIETGGFSGESQNTIYNECKEWLLYPWEEPSWDKRFKLSPLPNVAIGMEAGSVSDLIPSYAGLSYARVKPGTLIPLFSSVDLKDSLRNAWIGELLEHYGVRYGGGRIPVL